jgi:endonuclease YncB( thermonuclease family)
MRAVAVIMLMLAAAPEAAADIVGRASVVDGGTLEIRHQRIRLAGIAAPDLGQLCQRDAGRYPCGQQAARALSDHVGTRIVACSPRDRDRQGRIVALCSLDGEDLGEWLLGRGLAIAARYYSYRYTRAEFEAKQARRGVWAGGVDYPW